MTELVIEGVKKNYETNEGTLEVLRDVTMHVSGKKVVAIVGPSGCGKTTLARIIAGLEEKDEGKVMLNGQEINTPVKDIMVVFSSLNLLPWKTVEENIEMGVWYLPTKQRRRKVTEYIKLVGLEGFEEFYPKELSTSLAIRVELARALARESSLLILDDAFSSLDPLSATNLRNELLRFFWKPKRKPDILLVITNNIDEAVYMADEVFIMSNRPAHIKTKVAITLHHPRRTRDDAFFELVDKITEIITE